MCSRENGLGVGVDVISESGEHGEASADDRPPTSGTKHLALSVGPNLFADALAWVLAEDDVDEVIDLTQLPDDGQGRHFDAAVISPDRRRPDADVVIVLPPSGVGEVAVNRDGVRTTVVVRNVDALFDLLDQYCPADQPRRRPLV